MSARRRLIRLLTAHGWVRVRACELCAALVVADALEHHMEVHRATSSNAG